jgi:hypothetical protein
VKRLIFNLSLLRCALFVTIAYLDNNKKDGDMPCITTAKIMACLKKMDCSGCLSRRGQSSRVSNYSAASSQQYLNNLDFFDSGYKDLGRYIIKNFDNKDYISLKAKSYEPARGWKIHISIDDTKKTNLEKAWNSIVYLCAKHDIKLMKMITTTHDITTHRRAPEGSGRQFTLYVPVSEEDNQGYWQKLLQEIEDALYNADIPVGYASSVTKKLSGYLSYRNDLAADGKSYRAIYMAQGYNDFGYEDPLKNVKIRGQSVSKADMKKSGSSKGVAQRVNDDQQDMVLNNVISPQSSCSRDSSSMFSVSSSSAHGVGAISPTTKMKLKLPLDELGLESKARQVN